MPRPGADRPRSMNETYRCVVPARAASSSWLNCRRRLHARSSSANGVDTRAIPCRELPPSDRAAMVSGMDTTDLVECYIELWNEPDQERRRTLVRALWAKGGRQVLKPPVEIRERAAALGFPSATLEVRGHDELDVRVARAYADFIAPGQFAFRLRDAPVRLQDAIMFSWSMVRTDDGTPAGGGHEVLLVDDDGKICVDYQFIDP
jgi:hypothetical protein